MSFSRKDRKVRAEDGKYFPIDPGADTEATFAMVVADALRQDFGTSPAMVKHIARLTGANVRTVQNWIYGRNGPNGAGLVVLIRHSDAVLAAVLSLADRQKFSASIMREQQTEHLRKALITVLECLDSG